MFKAPNAAERAVIECPFDDGDVKTRFTIESLSIRDRARFKGAMFMRRESTDGQTIEIRVYETNIDVVCAGLKAVENFAGATLQFKEVDGRSILTEASVAMLDVTFKDKTTLIDWLAQKILDFSILSDEERKSFV